MSKVSKAMLKQIIANQELILKHLKSSAAVEVKAAPKKAIKKTAAKRASPKKAAKKR